MQIIPMCGLKNTTEVKRRCVGENGSVFVTKNGYSHLVVMDIEHYERSMQKICEAKVVMGGLEDVKAGRTVDGDTAMGNLRDRYGI
ncbi:hypothetical protein JNUCC1_00917 [Lentibacillus sp. JNUCC-1]|nr:hypothetical protein [Lentibacillus sp. JNUCC-1]